MVWRMMGAACMAMSALGSGSICLRGRNRWQFCKAA
jgi:hypothetical protein